MPVFFDTHAHIGLIHDEPIEQLIAVQEAKQQSIRGIISICNNLLDFFQVYDNLYTSSIVYFSIGISPSEVQYPGQDWEMKIEEGLKKERVVALGETGLDYYRKFGNKNAQIELFIRQLELADQYRVPVIIHNREAGKDIMDILSSKLPAKGGVLHCFSEDYEYAAKMLDMHSNLYFSFAGNVTYRNAHNLHETVQKLPLERIVIESEAPFMVPSAYRGKRNRPSYLPSTAEFIASLRPEDDEEVYQALFDNAQRLFQIQKD